MQQPRPSAAINKKLKQNKKTSEATEYLTGSSASHAHHLTPGFAPKLAPHGLPYLCPGQFHPPKVLEPNLLEIPDSCFALIPQMQLSCNLISSLSAYIQKSAPSHHLNSLPGSPHSVPKKVLTVASRPHTVSPSPLYLPTTLPTALPAPATWPSCYVSHIIGFCTRLSLSLDHVPSR